MADVLTQFSTVSTDAPSYYIARRMFELAERNLVLGRYATRYELPQRMGTTLRAVRVSRLNLPTSALTEGVAPDAVALAITNQDVTVQQWGLVVLLTDVAEMTTVHPMLTAAIERTSLAMSEMFEREMAQTLMTGTNVTYVGGTTRNGLTSANIMSTAVMIGATTSLRRRGAIPIKGSLYGGVMSPQQEADMLAETNFQANVARGQDLERLDFAKIGNWMGIEWVRSNFLPFFLGTPLTLSGMAATVDTANIVPDTATAIYTPGVTVTICVVSREKTTGYERGISQQTAVVLGGANTSYVITTPTDTDFVYDLYSSGVVGGTGTPKLWKSRTTANTAYAITALPTGAAAPASPADEKEVFVAFIFGKDAFARVELNGMSLRAYLTPAGASFSNPLAQGRKIGSKVMWNSWILDNEFYQRIESGSAYPTGLTIN